MMTWDGNQPPIPQQKYIGTMKTEHIVRALEGAVRQLGLEVRWEKGRFRGGQCLVNGQPLVMLNKHHPAEIHLAILAETLRTMPVDTIYLRPAVRDALEEAWERQATIPAGEDYSDAN